MKKYIIYIQHSIQIARKALILMMTHDNVSHKKIK